MASYFQTLPQRFPLRAVGFRGEDRGRLDFGPVVEAQKHVLLELLLGLARTVTALKLRTLLGCRRDS